MVWSAFDYRAGADSPVQTAPPRQDSGMSLLSLLAVLLLEQIRPLPYRRFVDAPLARLAAFLESRCNAGEQRYGAVAWLIGVGGLVVGSGAIAAALAYLSPLLAWTLNVVVLYATMGFRHFSHYYTDIRLALRMGEVGQARQLLEDWRGTPLAGPAVENPSEIARWSIEQALCASHRHVFGVLVCFLVLPGPCGAVLYRASAAFADAWGQRGDAETAAFGSFAQRSFAIIDWLPARLTAATFAIVGNFGDAMYCWRTQADKSPDDGLAIVVASGAGALGVRLGVSPAAVGDNAEAADDADVDFMESAVGLIWRALVTWMLLLLLLGLANLVGG